MLSSFCVLTDNCSGQNKNRFVLNYLLWRVIHRQHEEITLNFLITGDTKFAPDWCFGLMKQQYRRTKVNILEDIADVVKHSTVSGLNIPQLVGTENGSVFVEGKDLDKFFGPVLQTTAWN